MKKNHKKIIFSALSLAVFLPLVSMAASDSLSFSKGQNKDSQQALGVDMTVEREARRNENRASHNEMMAVLETGDYHAWSEFAKTRDCSMMSQVNEENFDEFVAMHKAKAENRSNGQGRGHRR